MSEEQAQQLLYQMQMLEGYLSELSQKEATIVSVIREASSAIQSLKTIDNKMDNETLIPVGLGTFIKTKVVPNEKLILNVGAGIAVEKDKDSAINFLELRLKEMQVALQETSNQKQQMEQMLAASRSKK